MTIYSQTEKVYKGLPYTFRCRVFGKYDGEFNETTPNYVNKSYTDLTDYDGFHYTTEMKRTVNAIQHGNPTITDDGIASNFSKTSYLELPTAFNPADNIWEINLKFKTATVSSSGLQRIIHSCKGVGQSNRYGIVFGIVDGVFCFQISTNGSSWNTVNSTYSVQSNTTYWVKVSFDGTNYKTSYSLDGNTYIDDINYSSTKLSYSLTKTYIGAFSSNGFVDVFTGSIDLSECSIKTGSQYFPDAWTTVWTGTTEQFKVYDFSQTVLPWKWKYQYKIKTSKYALGPQNQSYTFYSNKLNGTASGVTITNKIVDNFNKSNKITTNCSLSITPEELVKGLEIQIHLITGAISNQWIISNDSKWNTGLGFTINHGAGDKFWFILGNSDGSKNWQQTTTTIAAANTEYWIRLIKEQGNVNALVQISSDGVNWTTENELDMGTLSSTFTTSGTITLGNLTTGGEYFKGKIFLQDTFVKIGGVEKWRGFDKQIYQGCINGDTDPNGEYNVYAINGDDHIELVKKTNNTINTSATNPRYLGTI